MDRFSYISNADVNVIDDLYQKYQSDPDSVDVSWQRFFEGFEFSIEKLGPDVSELLDAEASDGITFKELGIRNLIHAYRTRGHLKSDTNPVRPRRKHNVRLDPADFGLSHQDEDIKYEYEVGHVIGLGKAKFRDIFDALRKVYTGPIGFEYMHIRNHEVIDWFKEKAEKEFLHFNPDEGEKKHILSKLNEAVVFENFLHTKYIGQKRFSLEGGENTIPALDRMIRSAIELGVEEVVVGMAHRGRLNVLANIMQKTYEEIFSEFEGTATPDMTMGYGDVKYHLGYSSKYRHDGQEIYLKLAPNPSHLEAVDPVVLGYTRAQIDDEYAGNLKKALPILIHGDAAVAGQGIVYEITQMANLPGYTTGGTIHFVINNQMGFTTDYDDARSSIYCTDIGKIVDAPILHVNGDDAEAVNFCSKLAVDFRQKFGQDIYIDLLCYRRHGHNESDEPKFTQPKLYNVIAKHPNPREVYSKKLVERGDADAQLAKTLDKEFRGLLQARLNQVKQKPLPYQPQKMEEEWKQLSPSAKGDFDRSPTTAISPETLEKVAKSLTGLPKGFKPIKQIEKLIKERKGNFFEKKMLSWADAELLAYGSLLLDGKNVRISGQDVKRGTFSHRHSMVFDAETNQPHCFLCNIEKGQPEFKIYNSLLSEFGVLGFEYGYAMASPNALVVWEAQFGDFSNGAQVMIDQFISSAGTKWQRMNGLVMLLPHGYEGQGPEHSSARPERFLELSADDNMVIANITTPANFFHLIRRQLVWKFRKPCVVMSPKSLLRNPEVMSSIEDFAKGSFRELIDDEQADPKNVKRLLLCSGKIYFDLLHEQRSGKRQDVAIVRVEQLFPFPEKQLANITKKYKEAKQVLWVQEEPENMGAWSYMLRKYRHNISDGICRPSSASPATGYAKIHRQEQLEIVQKAFET
jgi:2-oxoglutarate dehydrogenase E1 component